MSDVLKFPDNGGIMPLHLALDKVLASFGIPQDRRDEAVSWAKEFGSQLQIPEFTLSIAMPEGLTPEQVDQIRREVHREVSRYRAAIVALQHDYIMGEIKRRLGLHPG